MARKISKKKALTDRIVYEVTTPKGSYQVEASATKELKTAITSLLPLPLEPYSVQAAAHLAHVERATVQGQGWSIKRVGVLSFVPDTDQQPAPKPTKKEAAVQAPQATTEQPDSSKLVNEDAAPQAATEQQNAVYDAFSGSDNRETQPHEVEETPRNPHGG